LTSKRYPKSIYKKDALLEGIKAFRNCCETVFTESPEAFSLSFTVKDGSTSEEEVIGEFDNYVLSSSIALEFHE
jgi:hypothetical protein